MKVAVIIPPKDFKDETLSMAKLLFDKWEVKSVISSYTSSPCTGLHGAVYMPEINASKIEPQDYNAILLIDGSGIDSYKLYDFRPLLDLLKNFAASGKIVGAIGNAVKVLSRANIIAETKVAAPQDEESQRLVRLYKGINSQHDVEIDRNIITARSSDQAETFVSTFLDALGAK